MGVAGQFSALPMESLIGGPLQAAATAQGTLANITSDFITNVGLEKDGDKLKARTVAFNYQKPVKNTTTDKDGNTTETWEKQEMSLDVPLLSIVKSPNLQVKEVDINFNMEVKASSASTNENSQKASPPGLCNNLQCCARSAQSCSLIHSPGVCSRGRFCWYFL